MQLGLEIRAQHVRVGAALGRPGVVVGDVARQRGRVRVGVLADFVAGGFVVVQTSVAVFHGESEMGWVVVGESRVVVRGWMDGWMDGRTRWMDGQDGCQWILFPSPQYMYGIPWVQVDARRRLDEATLNFVAMLFMSLVLALCFIGYSLDPFLEHGERARTSLSAVQTSRVICASEREKAHLCTKQIVCMIQCYSTRLRYRLYHLYPAETNQTIMHVQ